MKEDFLHYVWMYQLYTKNKLVSTQNEIIHITKPGTLNRNEGPDFLNATVEIGNQVWVGNVEIHLKSSDWYVHHHESDVNYDATILHVVYEHDVDVFLKDNIVLPTLVLKGLISEDLLAKYQMLSDASSRWISCESQISTVDAFVLSNWKERLFFERLERKAAFIDELLLREHNNFEAILFQLFAKSFGMKVNGDSFLLLAQSIDFSIIRKTRFSKQQLEALLFGQAGFLEEDIQEVYYLELKNEYEYLKHKYDLKPLSKKYFSFFRMRPNNFPTLRIAQLVSLYHLHQNLFSKLMDVTNLEGFYKLLSVAVPEFWQTHYTFDSISKKSAKKITKSFVDLLVINTILPLKFSYDVYRGVVNEEAMVRILKEIKPEKNSIIAKFKTCNVEATSAFDSQALLELKNNYCVSKKCLSCAVGNNILKRG